MNRFLLAIVAFTGLAGGCNKPPAEDCRKAIVNMQKLLGTDTVGKAAGDTEGEIRRCKGGSSKEAVACAAAAATLEDLKACGFMTAKPVKP